MVITDKRFCSGIWENIEGCGFGQRLKSLLPSTSKTIYIENTNNINGQRQMIKAYKLKLYPNKGKAEQLDELLAFWRDEVNRKIRMFWHFKEVKGSYPPKEYTKGGRLIRDASTKAWQIVKGAKKEKQTEEPFFTAEEIDLNEFSGRIIEDFGTEEFDLWLSVLTVTPRVRVKLPCKKYEKFNKALEIGRLRKSFKIKKIRGSYYAIFFVETPEVKKENKKVVGLDVGLNRTVATSDGKFFGDDLKDLRIRTKWRKYDKGLSAFKQGLNRVAKELVEVYNDSDFAVEKLLFTGKKGRSRIFRRRNNNWAYSYLSHRLKEIGCLKGFRVFHRNPRHSSQRCPVCRCINKANRKGEKFLCVSCGFSEHADTVGALNHAKDVAKEHPFLELIAPKSFLCSSINLGGG